MISQHMHGLCHSKPCSNLWVTSPTFEICLCAALLSRCHVWLKATQFLECQRWPTSWSSQHTKRVPPLVEPQRKRSFVQVHLSGLATIHNSGCRPPLSSSRRKSRIGWEPIRTRARSLASDSEDSYGEIELAFAVMLITILKGKMHLLPSVTDSTL